MRRARRKKEEEKKEQNNGNLGKGDFELGFGLNSSTFLGGSDEASYSATTRFNISLSGEYYFSDKWGVKAKLIYDRKGELKSNIDYITLPVMADFHFGSKKNWYINLGPYVGFLVSAKTVENDADIKDFVSSVDFNIAGGLGYKFEVSESIKLYVEYAGQSGLTDIVKDNTGNAS